MTTVLPPGPVLTAPRLGALALACGRHLTRAYLKPRSWADRWQFGDLDIITGIYLITDRAGRLRWLGQASRRDGLVGRLDAHHQDPAKRAVFASVRVLHLDDQVPAEALDAIEGRCADVLDIRRSMRPRRWPPAGNWLALVA